MTVSIKVGSSVIALIGKIGYTYTFMNNPCIRCGTERIDGKTWKEKSGISIITHTKTFCPDAECQKIIDKINADRVAKNDLMLKNKADAKLAREKLLAAG